MSADSAELCSIIHSDVLDLNLCLLEITLVASLNHHWRLQVSIHSLKPGTLSLVLDSIPILIVGRDDFVDRHCLNRVGVLWLLVDNLSLFYDRRGLSSDVRHVIVVVFIGHLGLQTSFFHSIHQRTGRPGRIRASHSLDLHFSVRIGLLTGNYELRTLDVLSGTLVLNSGDCLLEAS